jgi:hypothetical protein
MPYEGEYASKTSHSEILKNPDIQAALKEFEYLKPPSDEEIEAVTGRFLEPPLTEAILLPDFVIAVDGSDYEASIDEKLPSTKVGYVKASSVLISLQQFGALRDGRFVDPFKVAMLQNNNTALTFVLPSANIRWQGKNAVRESFRALLDQQLLGEKTRFSENDYRSSLRTTLFHLASRRPGEMGTGDPHKLKIYRCPTCSRGPITIEDIPEQQSCPFCNAEIYPSDCLRIWEEVNDYQSNLAAINRFMLVLEHLLPIHYIRYFYEHAAPALLANMAFFMDGPLAIFGTAAWMHRSIMVYLDEINQRLRKYHLKPLLIIGLQKNGQVVDHVSLIDRFLPNNRLFAIDDKYRYKYILASRDPSRNGFGFETYYGQDFIFKTTSGRSFVFALHYPYNTKDLTGKDFIKEKVKYQNYLQLPRAIRLITHFESDLYKNAVVPIALAHRYTAISLQPGGRVLDLLTKQSFT